LQQLLQSGQQLRRGTANTLLLLLLLLLLLPVLPPVQSCETASSVTGMLKVSLQLPSCGAAAAAAGEVLVRNNCF
jgi:hypothetical protein